MKNKERWIDQNGQSHEIESMATSHLFFLLTMLWNNSMPVKTRVNYKKWGLSPFRDKRRIVALVGSMYEELCSRDLTDRQRQEIRVMEDYYQKLLQ